MLIRIKINEKWGTHEQVCGLYETERDSRMKIRLLAIKLAIEGKKSEEIADLLNITGVTIRKYMKRWNQRGYEGLRDIPHPEVKRKLTESEMIEIDKALQKSPREAGIERSNWTAPVLIEYIRKQFGKTVSDGTCYNIFKRLKYTKTRPKKQNKKLDVEAAENFCEDLEKLVKEKDENTVILYEDEAIFTSEPTICAMWTKEGSQGIVPTSGDTRKRNAVFGAVNPENGDLFEHFAEAANTESFKEFMLKVSNSLSAGVKAIMPVDNAKYHHFKGKDEWWADNIPNITLLYLPSHCSFLNAIEHLWKDVRTAVTHNTLFDKFSDMITELKNYLGELKTLPEKLANLCRFIY
jgi:transposase